MSQQLKSCFLIYLDGCQLILLTYILILILIIFILFQPYSGRSSHLLSIPFHEVTLSNIIL